MFPLSSQASAQITTSAQKQHTSSPFAASIPSHCSPWLPFSSHNITKGRNNVLQHRASTPCSRAPACPAASPCPRRDSRSCHQPRSDSGSLHASWHARGGSWPVFWLQGQQDSCPRRAWHLQQHWLHPTCLGYRPAG